MSDLHLTFLVDQTPEQAFDAIKNVRGWWSQGIVGDSDGPGDAFTYRYEDLHYSRQELVESVPGERVEWRVLDDAHLKFTRTGGDWKGTRLRFDLRRVGGRTEVRFTHVGLRPESECYAACSEGWGHYVGESLRSLITTGAGQPDPAAKARHP